MTPFALWLPFVVPNLDTAVDFWEDRLGLRRVDAWSRDGERGVVLRASCGAVLEFVEPPHGPADSATATQLATGSVRPRPVTVALELATWDEVYAAYTKLASPDTDKPIVQPRGHYGFSLRDPHGIEVFVWSERAAA